MVHVLCLFRDRHGPIPLARLHRVEMPQGPCCGQIERSGFRRATAGPYGARLTQPPALQINQPPIIDRHRAPAPPLNAGQGNQPFKLTRHSKRLTSRRPQPHKPMQPTQGKPTVLPLLKQPERRYFPIENGGPPHIVSYYIGPGP